MAPPVIAWLTDFGTRDHYVAAMKGVALSIAPEARLVDITHEIDPQDVLGGAIELAASYRFFPDGTIFVAVVDPGVGSTRRAIAATTPAYTFVAPDNGILSLVFAQTEPLTIVELDNPRFALPVVSRTFEGRDRFAPAAAWLARGTAIEDLGRRVTEPVRLTVPALRTQESELHGEVVRIDRFGNAITNIPQAALEQWASGRPLSVSTQDVQLGALVQTYADVAAGSMCALFGSTGHLEIAVAGGSAAAGVGLRRGSQVVVRAW